MERKSPLTGMDLKLMRIGQFVSATELARFVGVNRSRIGHIESQIHPTENMAKRYIDGLAAVASHNPETDH